MMNFYTAAIFMTLFFCMFSGIGEELSEGFNQNPEYIIPSPAPEKPAEDRQSVQPVEAPAARPAQTNETGHWEKPAERRSRSVSQDNYNPHRGTAYLRRNNSSNGNYGSDNIAPNTPWVSQELKNWESRQNPVPSALPRVTDFHPKSSRSSYRNRRSSSSRARTSKHSSCSGTSCSSTSCR